MQCHCYYIANYQIVINCTPIGTSPDTEASPAIPYHFLQIFILLMIWFTILQKLNFQQAKAQGATIKMDMIFFFQAEKSWEIWINKMYLHL
jgi:shikimate dehydrogenase